MNRRISLALLLVMTGAIALAELRPRTAAQDATASKEPRLSVTSDRTLQGTVTCATSLCHGGTEMNERLSEYTTWLAFDPHARAHDTLTTAQSQDIADRRWGDGIAAADKALCLKCHVHPDYANARPNFRRQDGVGCESCHGAAEQWLTPHYRKEWKTADKSGAGFADTKKLLGRATICAGCHVGTRDAAVDHDLIAAGHPVLRFEFATYLANLPPHWNTCRDRLENSSADAACVDFAMRAWTVGQLVSAAAAFDLVAHQENRESGAPWPEFASLDCYACHHDLKASSWRQKKEHVQDRRRGAPAWNAWYFAMVPDVLPRARGPADELGVLRDSLSKLLTLQLRPGLDTTKESADFVAQFRPNLSPTKRGNLWVSSLAAAGLLRESAKDPQDVVGADPGSPATWLKRLGPDRPPDRSWDEATQRYLALLSLRQMRQDSQQPDDADLDRLIATLRDEVTFDRRYASPHGFVPKALR